MRLFKAFFILALLIFTIQYVTLGNGIVYADDHEEKYEHHEHEYDYDNGDDHDKGSDFEDFGKILGWGTVAAMGVAGIFFPMRRSAKLFITNFPGFKNFYLSLIKYLGKFHILLGITALGLGIFHGVTMFLSEGELESEGIIGLTAVGFMVIAAAVGAVLAKNKKVKSLRTLHIILIVTALLIGVFHIINA